MASRDDSRVVFVGNIPYDGTEQQLVEQFSEVGTVVSFRLVNDRETGKPKGFGFCEYKDAETARSAIRNLNGIIFHGRSLRVDTADDDQASTPAARPTTSSQQAPTGGMPSKEKLGIDAIGQVVDSLPNEQQVEVLAQMKQLIESDPDGARRLLHENQQLAQAMLRILIVFDAVKPEDIQSLSAIPMVQPVAQPPQFVDVPMPMQYEASAHQAASANFHMMHRGPPSQPSQPPRSMPPHGAPGPGPRTRRPVTSLPPQKAQLLQTIMSMTPEQFAALSPEMQQKVAILRSRIGARSGGIMPRPSMGGPPPRPY